MQATSKTSGLIPTLNDVTLLEAKQVRMDESARVIENGIDGPVPGTLLARCSQEMRALVQDADLIISKGGGNFDSLDEEEVVASKICFMLLSKCVPYREHFGTELTHPILSVPSPWLDD
ncbi:MAG: ARMT1-like domain-containing protein [Deltaproteobacteria bacterium]